VCVLSVYLILEEGWQRGEASWKPGSLWRDALIELLEQQAQQAQELQRGAPVAEALAVKL